MAIRLNPKSVSICGCRLLCLFLLLGLLLPDWSTAADQMPLAEHQLQALYLYNLTKYMEWPADAFNNTNAPFTIGLMAGPELRRDLEEITRGKEINGRHIEVRSIAQPQEAKACQLIFLESGDKQQWAPILNATKVAPVLPVGVSDDFIRSGGVICFARKDNKLRLKIDLNAARRARFSVSAKLMAVAEDVSDQRKGSSN